MSLFALLLLVPLPQELSSVELPAMVKMAEEWRGKQENQEKLAQLLLDIAKKHSEDAAQALMKLQPNFSGPLRETAIRALGVCKTPYSIEALKEILTQSRHIPDRLVAVDVLADQGDSGLQGLFDLFEKEDHPQIRALTLKRLSMAEWPNSEQLILKSLKEKNGLVRSAALRGVAKMKLEKGAKISMKSLADANLSVRIAAAKACGEVGGRKSTEALVKAVKKARAPDLRLALRNALARSFEKEQAKVLAKAVGKAKKEDLILFMEALVQVAEVQPEVSGPAFIPHLKSKVDDTRRLALRGIEASHPDKIWDLLVPLLDHELVRVRADAVRALRKYPQVPKEHQERILALASHENPAVRLGATMALSALPDSLSFPVFLQLLKDPTWTIRDVAVETLEMIRTMKSVKALAHHMENESGLVRDLTYHALMRMTGEDFGRTPYAWGKWAEDRTLDYTLPTPKEAEAMKAARENRKSKSEMHTIASTYHGITIRPGGVVFILDVSGSMGMNYTPDARTYFDFFTEELRNAIQHLTAENSFGIVLFSSSAQSWQGTLLEANDKNKSDADAFLDKAGAYGGTNLWDSLRTALDIPDVQSIYLMTDGDPTVGETLKTRIVDLTSEMNRNRRIRIHTIAAGDVHGNFLEELAIINGGTAVDLRGGFQAKP